MLRLITFLAVVVAAATGLAWLADRPGNLVINWEGYEIETSVFRAVVLLAALIGAALFAWSLLRQLWHSPAAIGQFVTRRRQQRGLEALSSGMIAIGAGDRGSATRYAVQARKALPNEPLTHLLRAQAAQLSGDAATSRRIFEAMLASPDTEQLGLRGLFLEASREGETEAARQFAERALRLNPKLEWAVEQLFELQCKDKDWPGALATVAIARKQGHLEKASADRRRAVLLTAQAIEKEDAEPEKALNLAIEAHGLAPDLVPAAALAGRMLASRGNTPRATKIIQKTWSRSPHPDLATAYAYARLGDSPRDRFDRVRQLAMLNPMSVEGAVAAANAAIEAKAFDEARQALEPFLDGRLTQRICLLMARIEGEQHGNKGRVREWLARAVNAPRDPAWTADGVVSDAWQPVSPVTGALDAFQWRVPVEHAGSADTELLQKKLEELVPLGAAQDPALAAKPIDVTPAAAAGEAAAAAASARPTEPAPKRPAEVAEAVVVEARPAAKAPPPAPAPRAEKPATVAAEPIPVVAPAAAAKPAAAPPPTIAPPTAAPAVTAPANATPATAVPAPTSGGPSSRRPLELPSAAEINAKASAAYARLSERTRPAAPATEAAATTTAKPTGRDVRTVPPTKIFVPPRAPDDPGPEAAAEIEEMRPPIRGYRASS
jgi:HemY protein